MDALDARLDLQHRRGAALTLALRAQNVAELAAEIEAACAGALVRDVHALPPADALLVLARGEDGPVLRVRVSASPDAPRIHLQRGREKLHEGPVGPFFRRVAADLAGAVLRSVKPVAADRIVAFEFRATAAGETRSLVAELVGRHSNLVLLGPADRVLAVLVPAPAEKSAPRLEPGKPYAPPPGRAVVSTPGSDPWSEFPTPASEAHLFRGETVNTAPLSWVVECSLGEQARSARHQRARRELLDRVERKLARARSLAHGLEERMQASSQSERTQLDGELVKMHLSTLRRGQKVLEVEDVFTGDGSVRKIALDPKLSPHENLERLFDRAKKLERARESVASELAIARAKVVGLEKLVLDAHADALDVDAVEALAARAVADGLLEPPQPTEVERRKELPPPRLPYKRFDACDGGEIRVGRNAKDNDELTFHYARGSDVWLHTADAPGSHVVLLVEKNREPHPEELIDAAHLAVHFSPLAGATRARVHVARRKEVHKPRGAKPGLVTLSGGKILELRMQPERLERLLRTPRTP